MYYSVTSGWTGSMRSVLLILEYWEWFLARWFEVWVGDAQFNQSELRWYGHDRVQFGGLETPFCSGVYGEVSSWCIPCSSEIAPEFWEILSPPYTNLGINSMGVSKPMMCWKKLLWSHPISSSSIPTIKCFTFSKGCSWQPYIILRTITDLLNEILPTGTLSIWINNFLHEVLVYSFFCEDKCRFIKLSWGVEWVIIVNIGLSFWGVTGRKIARWVWKIQDIGWRFWKFSSNGVGTVPPRKELSDK